MVWNAWMRTAPGAPGSRSISVVVLALTFAVTGCQSTQIGDRPILPLLTPKPIDEPSGPVTLGLPVAVTNDEKSPANQRAGTSAPNSTGIETASLNSVEGNLPDLIRGCFIRDQIIDLATAFRLANGENPTIGLADELVQAQLAERTMARALLYPTLNVGTTLSVHQGALMSGRGVIREVNRESLYFGAGSDVRGSGTVAIPGVSLVGHLGDAVFAPRVADQRVTSGRFDAVATRHNVLLQVAQSYLGLLGAESRLLAFRQSENELAELARLTANFAATGQGRESDAQRTLSELSLVRSAAERTEEDVVAWATELSKWLSSDPTVRLRPEPGSPPMIQLVDERCGLESLIDRALATRPEIVARAADVARNETRLRQEKIRPLAPTISVGFSAGDFGGGSDQTGYRFSHFNTRTDFDVLAVWKLQNLGFGNRALQNRARAEIGQAEANRIATIEQIRREVAEALAKTQATRQQMEIDRRRVATAQTAFRQDLLRAKNREGHLIEALASLNMLTSARQDLVQSMIGYSQSQFQFYVALGGMPDASPAQESNGLTSVEREPPHTSRR